jgi:hypothetical protein
VCGWFRSTGGRPGQVKKRDSGGKEEGKQEGKELKSDCDGGSQEGCEKEWAVLWWAGGAGEVYEMGEVNPGGAFARECVGDEPG